jgi:hypothetical protein
LGYDCRIAAPARPAGRPHRDASWPGPRYTKNASVRLRPSGARYVTTCADIGPAG